MRLPDDDCRTKVERRRDTCGAKPWSPLRSIRQLLLDCCKLEVRRLHRCRRRGDAPHPTRGLRRESGLQFEDRVEADTQFASALAVGLLLANPKRDNVLVLGDRANARYMGTSNCSKCFDLRLQCAGQQIQCLQQRRGCVCHAFSFLRCSDRMSHRRRQRPEGRKHYPNVDNGFTSSKLWRSVLRTTSTSSRETLLSI